jgi:hypothetical protein
MTVAQAFVKLFGMLNTLLSLIGLVQGNTAKAAQENVPFHIDTVTSETWALASDSAVGLAAIKAELLIIDAHISSVDSSLAAAIAGVQLATNPVILPTTPPTGYGGGLVSGDAATIWHYVDPLDGPNTMAQQLNISSYVLQNQALMDEVPHPYASYVAYHCDPDPATLFPTPSTVPLVDPGTILSSDTSVLAWLNRTDTVGFTWTMLNNKVVSYSFGPGGDNWWICTIDALQFAQYKAVAPAALNLAPIWPGLANTVISASQPLTPGLTITIPMDGCIVVLDSVPDKASFFQFDDVRSYRNLGALSFFNDDADQEFPQSLGFTDMLYTPKTMVRAAGVKVRTVGGVTGRIWTWTIFGT